MVNLVDPQELHFTQKTVLRAFNGDALKRTLVETALEILSGELLRIHQFYPKFNSPIRVCVRPDNSGRLYSADNRRLLICQTLRLPFVQARWAAEWDREFQCKLKQRSYGPSIMKKRYETSNTKEFFDDILEYLRAMETYEKRNWIQRLDEPYTQVPEFDSFNEFRKEISALLKSDIITDTQSINRDLLLETLHHYSSETISPNGLKSWYWRCTSLSGKKKEKLEQEHQKLYHFVKLLKEIKLDVTFSYYTREGKTHGGSGNWVVVCEIHQLNVSFRSEPCGRKRVARCHAAHKAALYLES